MCVTKINKSLERGSFFFGYFLESPSCPGPVWRSRAEAGLGVDRVLSFDPVEHVKVAHLVVVRGPDLHRLVFVVHLNKINFDLELLYSGNRHRFHKDPFPRSDDGINFPKLP